MDPPPPTSPPSRHTVQAPTTDPTDSTTDTSPATEGRGLQRLELLGLLGMPATPPPPDPPSAPPLGMSRAGECSWGFLQTSRDEGWVWGQGAQIFQMSGQRCREAATKVAFRHMYSRAVLWDRDFFLLRTAFKDPLYGLFSTGLVRAFFEPPFWDPRECSIPRLIVLLCG